MVPLASMMQVATAAPRDYLLKSAAAISSPIRWVFLLKRGMACPISRLARRFHSDLSASLPKFKDEKGKRQRKRITEMANAIA